MDTRTCPQCGTVNPADSKFCDGCGINLTQRLQSSRGITPPAAPAQTPTQGTPNPAAVGTHAGAAPSPAPLGLLANKVTLQNGRYVIEKALGKGGMGSIFLAFDTRLNNKPVVIKQMLPNYASEAERIEAEESFVEEMRTLAALSHPNIPKISDYFTEGGYYFLVQEFVTGQDLQKRLDGAGGKGLPEKDVLRWSSQVLSVLAYLEKQDPQVIHRDIKPANIIVDSSDHVFVVDFGVASQKARPGSARSGQIRASNPMGTPGYAPREQFDSRETPLSDIYALGATMHQLLTGRNPQGVEPLFVYPPIKSLNPAVSDATVRIVSKALQNDPAQRYQNAGLMKAEIDDLLTPRGVLSTARGKAVALALVILALIAVGGGAALYEKNRADQQAKLPATGAISTGLVAFDRDVTGRDSSASDPKAWAQAKADASVQWKNGNYSRALALYQQAVTNDQTDAESWIYVENARIIAGGKPYWLIGVGSSYSGAKISSGREALQGAYTAQHEINQAGGIAGRPIVLELANDASGQSGATEAAQAAARDKNLLAFVGFSGSGNTQASFAYLAGATNQIPQISPTASSPSLNSTSPSQYFFRAVPSDIVQSQYLAHYALGSLLVGKSNPVIVAFRDPNDRYSNDLAGLFAADIGAGAKVVMLAYKVGVTTAGDYQKAIQGLSARPDLYLFAGLASDALRMGQALDATNDRTTPVLTDDAFYDPAQFNAYGAVYKGRYHFTGYFYPDEFGLLPKSGKGAALIKAMEVEYRQNFQGIGKPGGYGSDRVPSKSALYYDAVKLVAQAIEAASNGGGTVSRAVLRAALAGIHYQGIAGQIHFNLTPPADNKSIGVGDPIEKALLILRLDDQGHTHPMKILGTFE